MGKDYEQYIFKIWHPCNALNFPHTFFTMLLGHFIQLIAKTGHISTPNVFELTKMTEGN